MGKGKHSTRKPEEPCLLPRPSVVGDGLRSSSDLHGALTLHPQFLNCLSKTEESRDLVQLIVYLAYVCVRPRIISQHEMGLKQMALASLRFHYRFPSPTEQQFQTCTGVTFVNCFSQDTRQSPAEHPGAFSPGLSSKRYQTISSTSFRKGAGYLLQALKEDVIKSQTLD